MHVTTRYETELNPKPHCVKRERLPLNALSLSHSIIERRWEKREIPCLHMLRTNLVTSFPSLITRFERVR